MTRGSIRFDIDSDSQISKRDRTEIFKFVCGTEVGREITYDMLPRLVKNKMPSYAHLNEDTRFDLAVETDSFSFFVPDEPPPISFIVFYSRPCP